MRPYCILISILLVCASLLCACKTTTAGAPKVAVSLSWSPGSEAYFLREQRFNEFGGSAGLQRDRSRFARYSLGVSGTADPSASQDRYVLAVVDATGKVNWKVCEISDMATGHQFSL